MPGLGEHLVDDPLEVGVGAGDDPAPHVAGAGDRVGLEHLGDAGEVRGDGVVAEPWRISRVRNAITGKPSASGERSGPQPVTTPVRGQLVEAGLHGAAGHAEAAGRLEDADARLARRRARSIVRPDRPSRRLLTGQFVQRFGVLLHTCRAGLAVCMAMTTPRIDGAPSPPRSCKADLTLEQLQQLVGLVEYDEDSDLFPVTGWDADRLRRRQRDPDRALLPVRAGAWSSRPTRGPENGNRDHKSFVLRSGSIRFVINGAVDPDSPLVEHHRKHGDGVVDIALEVPDVDKCIAQARARGRDGRARGRGRSPTSTAPSGSPPSRRTARPATRWSTARATPAPTCPATSPGREHRREARGPAQAALPGRSTTSSATSSSARWTSGSSSTTRSWASRTWPSSSVTTSPPTTPR